MSSTSNVFSRGVARVFDRALARPAFAQTIQAGPLAVRLQFRSEALGRLYLASFLPHRLNESDISIGVVTAAEIDLSELQPDWTQHGPVSTGDSHFACFHVGKWPVLYLLDRPTRRGVIWLAAGAAPQWELSRPACPLIHAATAETGWLTVHGGAVGRDGRVLMLAGKGHSGKTTAALACARAGWDYAGDDYVFADTQAGRIAPLYVSARLRHDMTEAFADMLPATAAVSADEGDVRHELRLSGHLDPDRIKGGTLAAILLPRRTGAERPEFSPARRTDAFTALFMTTMQGMPGPLQWVAEKLKTLVSRAPTFFVDTGPAPEAIPDAFAEFLRRL
jgi:hypothetical protein